MSCLERVLILFILFLAVLILFLSFFAFLHCWLNAFAEMLRFGDRMFYKVMCTWTHLPFHILFVYSLLSIWALLATSFLTSMLWNRFLPQVLPILSLKFYYWFKWRSLVFSSTSKSPLVPHLVPAGSCIGDYSGKAGVQRAFWDFADFLFIWNRLSGAVGVISANYSI